MSFNPLDHPVMFSYPDRVTPQTPAWVEHAPMAMLLIDLLRPSLFVELGTHYGMSYCAFCQAVKALGHACRCFAVDTWQGDAQAGYYSNEEVLADLKAHHDPHYGDFSTLLQMTFDEARSRFADESIDLLHIDGYHTYEVARKDFDAWLPKMSARGVVVLHDIAERGDDFGVWKLWGELTARYPLHLSLQHSHGLGIVAVGQQIPEQAKALFALRDGQLEAFRSLAHDLGERILDKVTASAEHADREQLQAQEQELQHQISAMARKHETELSTEIARSTALQANLTASQNYAASLDASKLVRMLKLARASRAVLASEGSLSLVKRVGSWVIGKRGYHLRDIDPDNSLARPSVEVFSAWSAAQRTPVEELEAQRNMSRQFELRPLISFTVPVYNPDPLILEDTIKSVLAQTYDNWELCLVDGFSTRPGVGEVLKRYAERDERIRVKTLDKNLGIAGNSNEAIALARGEFISLLDHDDLIEPDLLYRVVEAINQQPQTDVVYYDENRVSADGKVYYPMMIKPGWSPELLLSTPYMTHCTIRRQLVLDAGGFDPNVDGTQDWDLFLRISERTNNITRVPRILYHWRMVRGSAAAHVDAKPLVFERQLQAIRNHMTRVTGSEAKAWWHTEGVPRVTWTPKPTQVSIIIPTKDNVDTLRLCLTSIFRKTTYANYDIVLVDTGSTEAATRKYYAALARDKRVKIVNYEGEFNYSRACNLGARYATGESLLFMNNDMEIVDADWLEELVRWSNIPAIGVVGAKLIYPDRHIQHTGVIIGAGGLAGHIYYGAEEHASSLFGSVDWYRDYLAVTGALHMMRREVYDAVGGYDETYDVAYSDVSFCYRVAQRGYRILYDPFVCIIHYESQTRDRTPSMHDKRIAAAELLPTIEAGDPYFSPHLSIGQAMPQLKRADEQTALQALERLLGDAPVTSQVEQPPTVAV